VSEGRRERQQEGADRNSRRAADGQPVKAGGRRLTQVCSPFERTSRTDAYRVVVSPALRAMVNILLTCSPRDL
jgi:hypothetical protein